MIQFSPILGATALRRGALLRSVVMRTLLGLSLASALLAISGCGQKGPLYLPAPASPPQHNTTSTQP